VAIQGVEFDGHHLLSRSSGTEASEMRLPLCNTAAARRDGARKSRLPGACGDHVVGSADWRLLVHLVALRVGCHGTCEGYADLVTFTRITVGPAVMGGMPCIRGLRVPVATVVSMVADGMSTDEIVADLPYLELEDIAEALRFAAEAVRERELPLLPNPA
jgi:uncharacterized protein (DUF433 family)